MERHSDQNGAVLSRRAIDGENHPSPLTARSSPVRPKRVQNVIRSTHTVQITAHIAILAHFRTKIQDPWCRAWQNESKNSTPSTTCRRTGTHSSSQNQWEPSGSDHKESHQMPHYKRPGSTQSTWSQVAYTLIVPGTCRPCFPTLSIK